MLIEFFNFEDFNFEEFTLRPLSLGSAGGGLFLSKDSRVSLPQADVLMRICGHSLGLTAAQYVLTCWPGLLGSCASAHQNHFGLEAIVNPSTVR